MTFGEKLYQMRTEQGMSQETLAKELGVSRQAISRWELGEVVPDTANVLAISRHFSVSTDYLLREDCLSDQDIPAVKTAEQSLKDSQYEVGSGIGYRFLTLAGPAVWHMHYGDENATLLLPFTLCWTLLFGILLARTMIKVRKRDEKAASRLLRRDALAVCCVCFLPLILKSIPGNWEIFLAQLAMVPPLQKNWMDLRKIYDLPVKPPQKKK